VAKAILLLDTDGLALARATLCAEATAEAREFDLPLFEHVLAQLSEGKELRVSGSTLYQLFQAGEHVATIEILDAPNGAREKAAEAAPDSAGWGCPEP